MEEEGEGREGREGGREGGGREGVEGEGRERGGRGGERGGTYRHAYMWREQVLFLAMSQVTQNVLKTQLVRVWYVCNVHIRALVHISYLFRHQNGRKQSCKQSCPACSCKSLGT